MTADIPFPMLLPPLAVILDLDNCCADDAWRIPYIDWSAQEPDRRYHAYHALGLYDGAAQLPPRLVALKADRDIDQLHIVTSRPARYRHATEIWLRANGIYDMAPVVTLNMRANSDHRPSPDVKRDIAATLWTEEISKLRGRAAAGSSLAEWDVVVHAFDDRADCLQAIAEAIPVSAILHISAIHSEDAYAARSPEPRASTEPASPAEQAAPSAEERIEAAAATFRSRNAEYGAAYRHFGGALSGLFPEGLSIAPGDAAAWGRLAVMVMLAGKLHRYARNLPAGGHADSAHDAIAYAAMLEELTAREGGAA